MPPRFVDQLNRILQLVLTTAQLQGENPVNLFVIGYTGTGKSELLRQYEQVPGVFPTAYTSFSAFIHHHNDELLQGRIRHILLGDLAALVNRPRDSVSGELAAWSVLLEEGLVQYETRATHFHSQIPKRVGLIAATTAETLIRARDIAPPGFLSRFLRISYNYSPETLTRIRESIRRGEYRNGKVPSEPFFQLPPPTLVQPNESIFKRLEESGRIERIRDAGDTKGLRTQRALNALIMANALLSGRNYIVLEDFIEIMELLPFFENRFYEI